MQIRTTPLLASELAELVGAAITSHTHVVTAITARPAVGLLARQLLVTVSSHTWTSAPSEWWFT
jgi:hypothetical protein